MQEEEKSGCLGGSNSCDYSGYDLVSIEFMLSFSLCSKKGTRFLFVIPQ